MRTTFTVDDDLVARLRQRQAREGASMAKVVNGLIRLGLNSEPRPRKKLKLRTFRSRVLLENLDNVAEILDVIETPAPR